MSFVTTVMVGNAESECARLGKAAMLGGAPAEAVGAREPWRGVATVMLRSQWYVCTPGRWGCESGKAHADGAEDREEAGEKEEVDATELVDLDIGTGAGGYGGLGYETNKGRGDGRAIYERRHARTAASESMAGI